MNHRININPLRSEHFLSFCLMLVWDTSAEACRLHDAVSKPLTSNPESPPHHVSPMPQQLDKYSDAEGQSSIILWDTPSTYYSSSAFETRRALSHTPSLTNRRALSVQTEVAALTTGELHSIDRIFVSPVLCVRFS